MLKTKIYILGIIILSGLMYSCQEEEIKIDKNVTDLPGIPVEIFAEKVGYIGTRDVSSESKKKFEIDDLLHIRAVFKCTLDDEEFTETQYGIVRYAGNGIWNALDGEHSLYWPDYSTSASFTAYYIYGSTGALSANFMPPTLLSSIEYGQDPLYDQYNDVAYGHAIRFEMQHILSHFTVSEMDSGVPEELWFTIPESSSQDTQLNNAFYLSFNEETFEMEPVFQAIPSKNYQDSKGSNLVYISSNVVSYSTKNGETMSRVGFFLQPGTYHQFALRYPSSRTEAPIFLSYTRDLAKIIEKFEPNGLYEFSILKSMGVVVDQTPDDTWDSTEKIVKVNVEKFLRAANAGLDYWETDQETQQQIQILEQGPKGSRLLVNADFNFEEYTIFGADRFIPNLSNTFDGNYHYIYNVACPIFYENTGIITNLGIRDARANNLISNELFPVDGINTHNTSYNGLLTAINRGTVSNIRLVNAEMTLKIQTSRYEATREAHNAALLFGVNYGNVYDINLGDKLELTVKNNDGETIIPNVDVGSITAQNFGTISGVTSLSDVDISSPSITIRNQCKGENGVYIIGGISGNNTGEIYDVFIEKLTIDCTESSGVESHIGGMIGELSLSYTGASHTERCIVRGEVKAGTVKSLMNVTAYSYIGGIAGSINEQSFVTNCSATIGVTGSLNYDSQVSYGCGGAFGRIRKIEGFTEGSIHTLSCFGSTLTGPKNVGNFAGVAPEGYTWDDNYAGKEINVKQYSQYPPIVEFTNQ